MLWLWLALAAALIGGIESVIDANVVRRRLPDPIACTVVSGVMTSCMFIVVALLLFPPALSVNAILLGVATGAVYCAGVVPYYKAVKSEEVSRVVSVIQTAPIFVLILATIFLGETFTAAKYAGIFVVVAGAALMSTKKFTPFKISVMLGAALLATIMFALGDVLIKCYTAHAEFETSFMWVGVGELIVAMLLLARYRPKNVPRGAVKYLFIGSVLALLGLAIFFWAVSLGPVSLVVTAIAARPLFILAMTTLLSIARPKVIREEVKAKNILIKVASIVMILVGIYMVS